MNPRSPSNRSNLLLKGMDPDDRPQNFTNLKKISDKGGSAICYEAFCKQKKSRGILKEFYPAVFTSIRYDQNGQLLWEHLPDVERRSFQRLMEDYLKPYQKLQEIRCNKDIATFIPDFEILHGCNMDGSPAGTVYIWSPNSQVDQFSEICKQIHEHPTVKPETHLLRVMWAIESLVKCLNILHKNGLIHGDITPDNFGFVKRDNELLTEGISFYDLDSIRSVDQSPNDCKKCTSGFSEPEARNMSSSNLTDIFSVGAVLFYAIIVLEDEKKPRNYAYTDYNKLKSLVDNSLLIQASEANSHPHLRSLLTKILRRTLCLQQNRYQSCEELLADVQKALDYIVPAEVASRIHDGKNWVYTDVEKLNVLDSRRDRNSSYALQEHLYAHPLYESCAPDQEMLDVLVVGFGQYGQKFADIVLQTAQMPKKHLRLTVVSASLEDKQVYLEERPALDQFFDVDGSCASDSYGEIHFHVHAFSPDNEDYNRLYLTELFREKNPDYVFVATGSDSIAIAKTLKGLGYHCPIYAAYENKRIEKKELQDVIPVYVCNPPAADRFFKEIERMAFNAHLIWEKNLNISFSKLRRGYLKPYNHYSNVSFVLAMQYKLYGIGIDIRAYSPSETAQRYQKCIQDPVLRNELIWLEHRRWIAEKLCLGYTCITDVNDCVDGMTKDTKRKRHVCLRRSRPDQLLDENFTKDGKPNKTKWNNPPAKAFAQLDDLDQMSVNLHNAYRKEALLRAQGTVLDDRIITAIHEKISADSACFIAFQELFTCMKDILTGDTSQTARFEGLQEQFQNALDGSALSKIDKDTVKEQLKILTTNFYPIYASEMYFSYKQIDAKLVDGIPFILTYTTKICMAIPFSTGSTNEIFSNLAASMLINPAKLLYLAYCENEQELAAIQDTLRYLSSFMKKKNYHAKIDFFIGCAPSALPANPKMTEEIFKNESKGRVERVKLAEAEDIHTFTGLLPAYLKRKCTGTSTFLLEQNKALLCAAMQGAGLYKGDYAFPVYSFDSVKMRFTKTDNCAFLNYLPFKSYITVSDMFSLTRTTTTSSNKPEFYNDFKKLWKWYQSHTGQWKALTGLIKKYVEKNDVLAEIESNSSPSADANEYVYYLPSQCRPNVELILNTLKSSGIIEQKSRITRHTTSTFTLRILDRFQNQELFDSLFSRVDCMLQTGYIHCECNDKSGSVIVKFNDLTVRNLDCTSAKQGVSGMLDYLAQERYIIALDKTDLRHVSFCFTTPQIKDLLSLEGRMLEVYTYHKARECGEFNDIRSSLEIDWDCIDVQNEFDCILTKGFNALFVECKATVQIKADYYNKLHTLTQKFGINAKAVLVADTQNTNTANSNQKQRGNALHIITITDPDEIANIGETLLHLLD